MFNVTLSFSRKKGFFFFFWKCWSHGLSSWSLLEKLQKRQEYMIMLKMSTILQKKAELQKLFSTTLWSWDLTVWKLNGSLRSPIAGFPIQLNAKLVTECQTSYILSFNNFRAISFHLNVYKTPFLKERNYVLLIAFGSWREGKLHSVNEIIIPIKFTK